LSALIFSSSPRQERIARRADLAARYAAAKAEIYEIFKSSSQVKLVTILFFLPTSEPPEVQDEEKFRAFSLLSHVELFFFSFSKRTGNLLNFHIHLPNDAWNVIESLLEYCCCCVYSRLLHPPLPLPTRLPWTVGRKCSPKGKLR